MARVHEVPVWEDGDGLRGGDITFPSLLRRVGVWGEDRSHETSPAGTGAGRSMSQPARPMLANGDPEEVSGAPLVSCAGLGCYMVRGMLL